ncbi:MAG: hypothetical protein HY682_04690 [Chloroflexi bacterium]|nr:hypothetical protein [Chloroflexota bacterium]
MPFDAVVRNGQVVLPGIGVQEIDLGIQDGRIAAHLARGSGAEAEEVNEAAGKVV